MDGEIKPTYTIEIDFVTSNHFPIKDVGSLTHQPNIGINLFGFHYKGKTPRSTNKNTINPPSIPTENRTPIFRMKT
jgi:hypothetical protein